MSLAEHNNSEKIIVNPSNKAVEHIKERNAEFGKEHHARMVRWYEEQKPGSNDLYIPPDVEEPLGTGILLRNYGEGRIYGGGNFKWNKLTKDAQEMYKLIEIQPLWRDEILYF